MLFKRSIEGVNTHDVDSIDNLEHNVYAGGQKNMEVGPALIYLGLASTEQKVSPGDYLFFFKTTPGVGWVTMSETAGITVGTAPADGTFPIMGEEFTRYSAYLYKYIKTSADIHVYILKDDSKLRVNP